MTTHFPTSAQIVRRLSYDCQPAIRPTPNPLVVELGNEPFLTDPVFDTSFLIFAEEFFEDNQLIAGTIQPRKPQKYAAARENFRTSTFAAIS